MHDEQLADYLAGEMTADERAAFEQQMRRDPALARQVQELRQTLGLVEQTWRVTSPATTTPAAHRFWRPLLRYAAAIAVAFTAGYLAAPRAASTPAASTATATVSLPMREALSKDSQLVAALQSVPSDAGFTRSMLVAAALTRTPARMP